MHFSSVGWISMIPIYRNVCLVGLLVADGDGCHFPEAIKKEDCCSAKGAQGDQLAKRVKYTFTVFRKRHKNCAR